MIQSFDMAPSPKTNGMSSNPDAGLLSDTGNRSNFEHTSSRELTDALGVKIDVETAPTAADELGARQVGPENPASALDEGSTLRAVGETDEACAGSGDESGAAGDLGHQEKAEADYELPAALRALADPGHPGEGRLQVFNADWDSAGVYVTESGRQAERSC